MFRIGQALLAGAVAFGVMTGAALAQGTPMPIAAPKREGAPRPPTAMQPGPPPITGSTGRFSAKAAQPGGFDVNQRALVDRVSLYLSTIQNLVGDFVQVGPDGTRTEGQLYLQKPGKIRFEYKPPSVIEVVADGSSVVVRDRKLATQDVYPLSQTPLRYLLADRIDLMRDTNVVSLAQDDVFVTVTIEEKQAMIGTSRLMMMFGAKDLQLRQWTVTDPQGFDTTVAVYNLDASKKPDPRMFVINYDNNVHRVQ
ncbi:MAG TPA: outer membrane lipoprotein carrier protein LolA [Xanthobacteraceae bacterium]|jgi:outer membrane lipoprotein-sorting protein|nr:outer membrane lipoprotein carrier protein LolA [Xanthobacteraceae bacterium]